MNSIENVELFSEQPSNTVNYGPIGSKRSKTSRSVWIPYAQQLRARPYVFSALELSKPTNLHGEVTPIGGQIRRGQRTQKNQDKDDMSINDFETYEECLKFGLHCYFEYIRRPPPEPKAIICEFAVSDRFCPVRSSRPTMIPFRFVVTASIPILGVRLAPNKIDDMVTAAFSGEIALKSSDKLIVSRSFNGAADEVLFGDDEIIINANQEYDIQITITPNNGKLINQTAYVIEKKSYEGGFLVPVSVTDADPTQWGPLFLSAVILGPK